MKSLPHLDYVRCFLAVAEELNFRRAAERLDLEQSTLTRRLQRLEEDLGFRLLERTTREVSLTQAGRQFYEEAIGLMHQYAESVQSARRVAEGKAGVLRVAYMSFAATELMPLTVARFRQSHPHIEIKLRYIRTRGQKMALANGDIDVGFMLGPFDHPEYRTVPMSCEPLYVVMPRNHPLLQRSEVTPACLADQDIILGDMSEWEEYRWSLNDLFLAEGIALKVVLEPTNSLALIGLVAAGMGITICPESLARFVGPGVETRQIRHERFRSRTELVWKGTNRSRQVQDFVQLAKQVSASSGLLPGAGS